MWRVTEIPGHSGKSQGDLGELEKAREIQLGGGRESQEKFQGNEGKSGKIQVQKE